MSNKERWFFNYSWNNQGAHIDYDNPFDLKAKGSNMHSQVRLALWKEAITRNMQNRGHDPFWLRL